MFRIRHLALSSLFLALAAPATAAAQGADWAPPSREMPMMPAASELQGDWHSSRANWFSGVEGIAGVSATRLKGSGNGQIARFSNGPVPVVVWTDRNNDRRADMIEIFKSGGIIIQLIDADFDGSANVVRVYDSEGKLLKQNPV